MIYLKNFNKESDYLAYRDGDRYGKPNVSLSIDSKVIHYNYPPKFIDLGLPSGTLWSTCNIGADKPSDSGLYFQWGDTSGYTAEQIGNGNGQKKFASNWSDYKWYSGGKFTKYTTKGAILDLEDDAAHAYLGGEWHMPTPTQIMEVMDYTTTSFTTSNETIGMTLTSKNGKSIFIPTAGCAYNGSIIAKRTNGAVWSSMLSTNRVDYGQYLDLHTDLVRWFNNYRYYGFPIRAAIG